MIYLKGENCTKNYPAEKSDKAMDWLRVFGDRKLETGKFIYDNEMEKFVPFGERKPRKRKGFMIGTRSHLNVPEVEYIGKDSHRKEKLCSGIVYK